MSVRAAMKRARSVDWWIHLIASSGRYNDSLHTISHKWSVREITQAHLAIDVWNAIEDNRQKSTRRRLRRMQSRHKT